VRASIESVTAAAAAAADKMPADFRVSHHRCAGAEAYPISSFTWLLIPSRIDSADKGTAIKKFLTWMLTRDRPSPAAALRTAPAAVVQLEQEALTKIQVGGK
jgi:phosphate transport system substrate-binding protein